MSDHQTGGAVAGQSGETRQERRERKLTARRKRMQKHGARFAQAYANAVRRRAAGGARPHARPSGKAGRSPVDRLGRGVDDEPVS